jgi:histidyl-tRNA synthetase
LRVVDKLGKQGEGVVMTELVKAGLTRIDAKETISFVANCGPAKAVLKTLSLSHIKNESFTQAVSNLQEINELLTAGGMKANECVIDLSIARGLDWT